MSEHNQKHLTLSNRTYIEQELLQKSTFSSIGEVLHKDPSTISKEVNKTPFELMDSADEKKLLSALNLSPIPPDEVILSPKRIKH